MNIYLIYLLVLRLIHVVGGVLWVGGDLVYFAYLEPTARAVQPDGQRFMSYLMGQRRFSLLTAISGILTVFSGFLLYWRISDFKAGWILSGPGLMLTAGAVLAFGAFFLGALFIAPTAKKMGQVSHAVKGPPSPGQLSELRQLGERLAKFGRLETALGLLALAAMALARYWVV